MKLDVYCIPVLGDIEFGENTYRISVNIGNFWRKPTGFLNFFKVC